MCAHLINGFKVDPKFGGGMKESRYSVRAHLVATSRSREIQRHLLKKSHTQSDNMLCYVYVMLRYVMLCYVMLCCVSKM